MTRDTKTELQLKNFYNESGWQTQQEGHSLDAALWEDLRPVARHYVQACRKRVGHFLPKSGKFLLDAASGPIQYPEYLEYSRGFQKRICVDISESALSQAKEKLGDKGEYLCASLQALPLPANHCDAVLSMHTIYHIDKDQQAQAVQELLRVAKPGAPVVIIYANPDKLLSRIKRMLQPKQVWDPHSGPIYYFAHPLAWWEQFRTMGNVEIFSWRSLTAQDARRLIPNNFLGHGLLRALFLLESIFPKAMRSLGAYPLIVLKKN